MLCDLPKSAKEARVAGIKQYFTGEPCKTVMSFRDKRQMGNAQNVEELNF